MKIYKIKDGISLPITKYIPGYGLVSITADTTDAQAEAIIATGHGHMFDTGIGRDAVPASNESETTEPPITTTKTKKQNGKARNK